MPLTVLHRPPGTPRERVLLIGGFGEDFPNALRRTDLLVEEILDGAEALESAARLTYGVVVCSLRMPSAWGLDVLDAILRADPLAPVILSTHEQNPKVVVEAMRRGAFDYLVEPYRDMDAVLATLERAVRRRASLRRGRELHAALAAQDGEKGAPFGALVGRSAALRELCARIRQVAPAGSPVLIEGESGAGKELVARALHDASPRRRGPFVALHCGAIPETLLESELFGHEKGAFTGAESTRVGVFEQAADGTLFLDEIGLTSPACQAKLLRVLETGQVRRVGASREFQVDVRVLSATNEPLEGLAAAKRFRSDLLYRLNVVTLKVPPLRERAEDVPLLAHHFAERFAREAHKPFEAFSEEALALLCAYPFPGNVRELRNIVERAVVFAQGPVIRRAELPDALRLREGRRSPAEEAPSTRPPGYDPFLRLEEGVDAKGLERRVEELERSLMEQALELSGGNQTRAAQILRIKRTTLAEKLARQEGRRPDARSKHRKKRGTGK